MRNHICECFYKDGKCIHCGMAEPDKPFRPLRDPTIKLPAPVSLGTAGGLVPYFERLKFHSSRASSPWARSNMMRSAQDFSAAPLVCVEEEVEQVEAQIKAQVEEFKKRVRTAM